METFGKKKGILKISKDLYENHWETLYPIFKDFKPIRIELEYWNHDDIILYGVSDKFDEVSEGEIIPYYVVRIDTSKKDSTVVFTRV